MPGTKHIRIGRVYRMYEELKNEIFFKQKYDSKSDIKAMIDFISIVEKNFPELKNNQ